MQSTTLSLRALRINNLFNKNKISILNGILLNSLLNSSVLKKTTATNNTI